MKELVMFEVELPEGSTGEIKSAEAETQMVSDGHWIPLVTVAGTLSIIDAPSLRIVRRDDGRGAIIYLPDKDDPAVDVFRRTSREKFGLYFSGHAAMSLESARTFAFVLLEATRIAEQLSEASATPAHERHGG